MQMDTPALPKELKALLRRGWGLDELVTAPLPITSAERLGLFLELLVPDHTLWGTVDPETGRAVLPGSKPVASLVKELHESECRLSVISWEGRQHILRDLRTATLTVMHSFPEPTEENPNNRRPVWLREYHLRDGEKVLRRHGNSMSEKAGSGESFRAAAVRAIHQELSLMPSLRHLKPPYFFELSQHPGVRMVAGPKTAEPFIYAPDVRQTPRYPGILTRNELERFIWVMPRRHFNPDGYHEQNTEHYFEWVPVTPIT